MIRSAANKIIKQFSVRHFSSALYITGDKAQNNFAILTPHVDFEERIGNRAELEENFRSRGVSLSLDKLEKRWAFFKQIEETKMLLELSKAEMASQIKDLLKEPEKNSDEIEKIKMHAKLVKDDIKNVRDYLYSLEESAMLMALDLPNVLHDKTPRNEPGELRHAFLSKPEGKSKHHLVIGKEKGWLECFSSRYHFLKNEAALFEKAVFEHCRNMFLDSSFVPFSAPDFVRSIVIEGCGGSWLDNTHVFTVEEAEADKANRLNRLHLVGGASLYSLMSYFVKHTIQQSYFPIKCFALGRKYKPKYDASSLFNAQQQSCLQVFVATLDSEELIAEAFEDVVLKIIKLYETLGYHFRLLYLPANKLKKFESLRLSVQMYSNFLDEYVEVGHVSMCGNYISKRLLFNYNDEKDRKFPKIISGCVLNAQKLLAVAIENNSSSGKNLISEMCSNV